MLDNQQNNSIFDRFKDFLSKIFGKNLSTQGKLIVLTGPSGVGKGTLLKALKANHPDLFLSISATTRQPRVGEVDGKDYFFLTREDFEAKIKDNLFLEWAEYAGNYYGTPRSNVEGKINEGVSVVLEIEVIGARKIKDSFPDALLIFILPPSMEELEQRLRDRGKDSETAINRRMETAKAEIAACDEFDINIVNDDLKVALQKVEVAIFGDSKVLK